MKTRHTLLAALLVAGTLTTSCDKDDLLPDPTPATSSTPAGNTTPTFAGADGVMWAIKTSTVYSGFTIQIGTGVGLFTNGASSYVNVGTVSLNGSNLTMQSNNVYAFTPSQTAPTGLDLDGGVSWAVSGGNGHSGFTYDASALAFPSGSAVNSSATVTKANGYTLSCSNVSDADSTIFLIGNISKTVAGSANSYTFTASELSGLSAGTTIAQIVPYAVMSTTINGKTYYFGKETVNQLAVTVE